MKKSKFIMAGLSLAIVGAGLASCSGDSEEGAPGVAPSSGAEQTVQQDASGDNTKPDEDFTGKPPAEYLPTMLRASTICNQVDVPFIAAIGGAQTGFNAQAVSGELKGAYLLSDDAVKKFGFDEDKDGKVDPTSPADATMTVARMSCQTAGIIDQSLSDPSKTIKGDPMKALAASVRYGEDPFEAGGKHDAEPLMQRWEKLYNQYRSEGVK